MTAPPETGHIPPLPVGELFEHIAQPLTSWFQEASKPVNDSIQAIYASFQALKVDLSATTLSYDAIKFDETGLSVGGIRIWQPNFIQTVEERINNRFSSLGNQPPAPLHRLQSLDSTVTTGMRRLDDSVSVLSRRVGTLERATERYDNTIRGMHGDLREAEATIRRHGTAIRGLLSNQRRLAATTAGETRRGAVRAQARSEERRNVVAPGRRAAAENEAARLRAVTTELRAVRNETNRLARDL